ncbi:MAG: hypothetical protein PHQ04_08750 [Opitutaceae bacterium]|nr:hypothetical protein [Opitutaceae bacterium]
MAQSVSNDALTVQEARNKSADNFARTVYYSPSIFDLSDLPAYAPEQQVSGRIRIWGSDMFGGPQLKAELENGFRKFHPQATFEYNLKGPAWAFVGLISGAADIGPARRLPWDQLLAFQRLFNHDPLVVTGMTGWAVNSPFAIMVNKANPLTGLTMRQLDGIFGAERSGGWVGVNWHPEFARGPEGNIRTWGQLGLTGEWRDRPINVYSYSLRCMFGPRFADDVLKGSDKWNEKTYQFFNVAKADGTLLSMDQQMADQLAEDPSGIAFFVAMRGTSPEIKALDLAATDGGPMVKFSIESVRNQTYPLFDRMFFYLNRKPGTPLDPTIREFMRFLLSREGQTAVARDTKMLPLTAEMIRIERQKLD